LFTSKKIAFLFGSGISIPAELPSMKELTQTILLGDGVVRHTDGTYYFSDNTSGYILTDEYVPRVKAFLKSLKAEIDISYQDTHETNYEDLYYVASQVKDNESGEYDNPAIKPFIKKIYHDLKPILDKRENDTHYGWTLLDIASEAVNYIRDVVWYVLSKPPKRLEHLNFIRDACRDKNIESIDIFTLNHDTLLENYFSNANIQINDGFGSPQVNGLRYWDPELLINTDLKVRLLKLHGSVSWFTFKTINHAGLEKVAIPLEMDIWHTKDLNGQRQWPAGGRPKFLAGTFNKMLSYTSDIYFDQYFQFHKLLSETRVLVVCGYGFRDKAINIKIVEWVYAGNQHKLLVIHPKPDELVASARGSIANNWGDWLRENSLLIVPEKIENVDWGEIVKQLNSFH